MNFIELVQAAKVVGDLASIVIDAAKIFNHPAPPAREERACEDSDEMPAGAMC